MKSSTYWVAVLATLLACSGSQNPITPTLPGDGDEHTADPKVRGGSQAKNDPWAGRDLIAPPPTLSPKPLPMPTVERFNLPSGLPVIAVQSDAAPTFQLRLAVRAGGRDDNKDKVGTSDFVASMITRGARGASEDQIARRLETVGAQLQSNSTFEATIVQCHAPLAGADACMSTTALLVSAPTFPQKAMDEVRGQLQLAARQSHLDPAQLASLHFQNGLWGEEHVRGWPMTERTVAAIDRSDLIAFHKKHYSPKNAVLVVVGPETGPALRKRLSRAFGRWRGGAVDSDRAMAEPEVRGLSIRLVDLGARNQAQIRLGHLGVAHGDRTYAAATLVNHVLGGRGPASRLSRAMAEAHPEGTAQSSFDRNSERGALMIAAAAPTAKAVPVMRLLIDQMGVLADQGPSEAELAAAITEVAGSYQVRLESANEIGAALLAAELHALPDDYVQGFGANLGKVSMGEAARMAKRWLDPQNLVVIIAGNAEQIGPELEQAGLTFETVAGSAPVSAHERAAEKAAAETPADPAEEKKARAVLDAALAAKGGYGKLSAVKTFHWKGKAELALPGGKVPAAVEKRFVRPDKLRLDMTVQGGGASMTITTALVGDKGWAQEVRPDGKRSIDFPKSEVEAGKSQIWRDQDFVLLRHREKGAQVAPLADQSIDGKPHHAIRVTAPGGKRAVTLLIDKKSKRLTGMSYSEQGLAAEERYSNYKAVNGIQVAHKRVTKSAQLDLSTEVTAVEINPKIDPSIFVKPK